MVKMTMLDVIRAGAKPVYNHPLTRRDEDDMRKLAFALIYGDDISRIGEWNDRGTKTVTSDEVLTGDIYHTRFTSETVRR